MNTPTMRIASAALACALAAPGAVESQPEIELVRTEHGSGFAPPSAPKGDRRARDAARRARCRDDPRVVLGQVSFATCLGAELFFRETFEGNGRTCGSCHPAQNNYTIDPRFVAQLPASDPLFVAEHDTALAQLEQSTLLRRHALVLVNPDGFEDPTRKFVVRSVSHMLGLATSITAPLVDPEHPTHATDGTLLPPRERLGWSGDGAPGQGELRDFADGAITQHMTRSLERRAERDFVLPSDEERDAIAAFSRTIGRMNELDLERVRLSDPGAERGRDVFLNGSGQECAMRCHVNAGANSFKLDAQDEPIGLANSSFDIATALVRLPEVDALGIPLDGGFGKRPLDLDGDGEPDSFGNGGMNVAPLIEAADTAPMYHSNRFATLEDAVAFYGSDDFAHSFVAGSIDFPNRKLGEAMPLSDADVAQLGRFLRVLNTALNLQMASRRLRAALEIGERFGDAHGEVQQGLLALARTELDDALEVLGAVQGLHPREQGLLRWTVALVERARKSHRAGRALLGWVALGAVEHAYTRLGSGMKMKIGEGTLMF